MRVKASIRLLSVGHGKLDGGQEWAKATALGEYRENEMAHGMGVVEYAILDESGGPNRRTAAKLQEAMTRSTMQKDGLPQAVEVVMATRTVSKRDQLVIIDVAGSGSGAAAA